MLYNDDTYVHDKIVGAGRIFSLLVQIHWLVNAEWQQGTRLTHWWMSSYSSILVQHFLNLCKYILRTYVYSNMAATNPLYALLNFSISN